MVGWVGVYMCMSVCVYIMRAWVHGHECACMCTCVCAHVCVYIMCAWEHVHKCVCVCMCTCECVLCVRQCVCVCVCARVCVHACVCVRVRVRICVCICCKCAKPEGYQSCDSSQNFWKLCQASSTDSVILLITVLRQKRLMPSATPRYYLGHNFQPKRKDA